MKINRILVIGLGGTGSNLVPLLGRFLYSIKYDGDIILADGDSYSESNIERQIFSIAHINMNKAEYQATVLANHIPFLKNQIEIVDKYLSKDDINEIIQEGTIVINCVDNLAARKYVEDRILELDNGAHICCGNELKTGQVQLSLRIDGEQVTPSIYKQSPVFNSENDDRSKMSCQDLAKLPSGGQLIAANAMSAVIAFNFVTYLMSSDNLYLGGTWVPCGTVRFDNGYCSMDKEDTYEVDFEKLVAYTKLQKEKKEPELAVI